MKMIYLGKYLRTRDYTRFSETQAFTTYELAKAWVKKAIADEVALQEDLGNLQKFDGVWHFKGERVATFPNAITDTRLDLDDGWGDSVQICIQSIELQGGE